MPCIYNRTTLLLKCLQNNLIIVIIRIGSNFFFQNSNVCYFIVCVCVLYIMKMNAYFQVFDLFE